MTITVFIYQKRFKIRIVKAPFAEGPFFEMYQQTERFSLQNQWQRYWATNHRRKDPSLKPNREREVSAFLFGLFFGTQRNYKKHPFGDLFALIPPHCSLREREKKKEKVGIFHFGERKGGQKKNSKWVLKRSEDIHGMVSGYI